MPALPRVYTTDMDEGVMALSLSPVAPRGPVVKIVACGCGLDVLLVKGNIKAPGSICLISYQTEYVFWAADASRFISLMPELRHHPSGVTRKDYKLRRKKGCWKPKEAVKKVVVYARLCDLEAVRPLVPSGVELRACDVDLTVAPDKWVSVLHSQTVKQLLSFADCNPEQSLREIFVARYLALLGDPMLPDIRGVRDAVCYTFRENEVWGGRDLVPVDTEALPLFNQVVDCFVRRLCLWAVRALEQASRQECPLDIKRVLCALVLG